MTVISSEEVVSTPWTLGDVAKSIGFVIATTVLVFVGTYFIRSFIPVWLIMGFALAAAFLGEMAMPLAVWLFGIRKYALRWSAVGFKPFDPVQGFLLISVVLVASFAVNIVYVQITTYFGLDSLKPAPVLPGFLTGVWRLIVLLVLAAGVAPLAEEAFFRGFIFTALKRRFGFLMGAAGSAAIFTAAHLQASYLIPVFVLGVLLAWLYEKTRSIWPCITLHFIYNGLAVIAAYSLEVAKTAT